MLNSIPTIVVLMTSALLSGTALADKPKVKVSDIDGSQDTTISIRKGALPSEEKIRYEIISGTDELIGDPAAGKSNAYKAWKTACTEWKKDFREDNRENRILSISCGAAKISPGESLGEYVYKSMTSYRMRVRMEEPLNAPNKKE